MHVLSVTARVIKAGAGLAVVAALLTTPADARGNKGQDPKLEILGPDVITTAFQVIVDGKETGWGYITCDARPDRHRGGQVNMPIQGQTASCDMPFLIPYGQWKIPGTFHLSRSQRSPQSSYVVVATIENPRVIENKAGEESGYGRPKNARASFKKAFSESELWADPSTDLYGIPIIIPVEGLPVKTAIKMLIMPLDNNTAFAIKWHLVNDRTRQYFEEYIHD